MNSCSDYNEISVCFRNIYWSSLIIPSTILLHSIAWLFFAIPQISYCISKKKWMEPVQVRYYIMWIVIVAMAITEDTSNSTTIEFCHCNCNTFECLTRIAIYIFLFIIWSWFLYNPSSKFTHEYGYLDNVYTCSQAKDYLKELQKAKPEITFYAINYHMKTKSSPGSGGTRQVRYNTDSFQETHFYNHLIQESMQCVPNFSSDVVTRVKLTKSFEFIDDHLKAEHEAKFKAFYWNSKRDEKIDTREEVHFSGFHERILIVPDGKHKPIWMNKVCLWIATFFLMSLPFQLLFKWRTEKVQYCINKRIDSVNATTQIRKNHFKKPKTFCCFAVLNPIND